MSFPWYLVSELGLTNQLFEHNEPRQRTNAVKCRKTGLDWKVPDLFVKAFFIARRLKKKIL